MFSLSSFFFFRLVFCCLKRVQKFFTTYCFKTDLAKSQMNHSNLIWKGSDPSSSFGIFTLSYSESHSLTLANASKNSKSFIYICLSLEISLIWVCMLRLKMMVISRAPKSLSTMPVHVIRSMKFIVVRNLSPQTILVPIEVV